MKQTIIALFLIFNVIIAFAQLKEENAIRKTIEDETRYYGEKNFEKFSDLWVHSPQTYYSIAQSFNHVEYHGWDAISDYLRDQMEQFGDPEWKPEKTDYQFKIEGNMAFVSFKENGNPSTRVLEKQGDKWGKPQPVGEDINILDLHWQTSVSANRNLYFGTDQGIMRSQFLNGKHQKPEKITQIMNSKYTGGTPFVAPDESYIIFSSDNLPDSQGRRDLYIGYRRKNGSWTDPVHLGNTINTQHHDLCPIITYDGKFLIYLSRRNNRSGVYWFPARFIEELKPEGL